MIPVAIAAAKRVLKKATTTMTTIPSNTSTAHCAAGAGIDLSNTIEAVVVEPLIIRQCF